MSQEQLTLAQTGLLSAAITSGATSLTLSQAPGFPTSPQFRLWWPETGEMMIVTAVASLTYTVTRGADGTTASAHNANEACYHWPTPGGIANYVGGPNPLTTTGDIPYGDTSVVPSGGTGAWLQRLAGDTSNTRKFLRTQASGGVAQAPAWDTLQAGDLPADALTGTGNVLVNGGCDFAQRQAPATLTNVGTNAADKYGADRWKMGIQNAIATAQAQYQRTDTNGALETGITARYYGTCKMTGAASKAMVYQPIEGVNCFPLASRALTFQVSLKASKSITVNIAILQLNSSGTIDTIPAQLNSSWSNTAGTDPTWATNLAVVGSKAACSVTTSWQTFSVNATAPSNAKNLLCVMWTDAQMSVNDTVSWTQAGLYDGNVSPVWLPRLEQQEMVLCERYFEKSNPLADPPGTNYGTTVTSMPQYAFQTSKLAFIAPFFFHSRKRATPTLTVYDAAGASNAISYFDTSFHSGGAILSSGVSDAVAWVQESPTCNAFYFHYTLDAEL